MRSALLFVVLACGCADSTATTEPTVTSAALASATLTVDGMTCGSCEVSIRLAASKLDGVHSVQVSYETGSATIEYDPSKVTPAAVAEAVTSLGYPTVVDGVSSGPIHETTSTSTFGYDPTMAEICQAGCAAVEDYEPSDVVSQPGAQIGELTRCPVSGVVFRVQQEQPQLQVNGHTWFTCCGACMEKLKADPHRFIRG